jgi:hypothetical protein
MGDYLSVLGASRQVGKNDTVTIVRLITIILDD